MLVYASLIPHLPIIDKNDPHVTPESVTVLNEISRIGLELYAAKPDTIVFISQHPHHHGNGLYASIMHSIEPSFAELGDLSRYAPLNVNLEFVSALQNHLSQKEYVLLHENTLDDVTSFGAHLLTKDFKTKPRIVALSSTHQSQELISYYAEKIEELVQETSQRIAVIGIGNGSAACTKESLFGQKEAGVEFEKKLSRNIASLDDESLQKLFEMSAGAYQDIMIPLAYLYYITKSHEPDFLSQSPVHAMGVMTHTIHINLRS